MTGHEVRQHKYIPSRGGLLRWLPHLHAGRCRELDRHSNFESSSSRHVKNVRNRRANLINIYPTPMDILVEIVAGDSPNRQ